MGHILRNPRLGNGQLVFHGVGGECALIVYPFDVFNLRDGYTYVRLEALTVAGDKIGFLVDGHQDVRGCLILRFVFEDDFLKCIKEGLRLFGRIWIAEFTNAVSRERCGGHCIFIAGDDFDTATAEASGSHQGLPAS